MKIETSIDLAVDVRKALDAKAKQLGVSKDEIVESAVIDFLGKLERSDCQKELDNPRQLPLKFEGDIPEQLELSITQDDI